ncbi:MAG: hypothetical protein MRZ79_11355 [Bacteroidia bacterium]|nr:hypothetical protein [Bacteroidia bacterium]
MLISRVFSTGLLLIVMLAFTFCPVMGQQTEMLKNKKVGFYISGKNFSLDPVFNLKYAQFLKQGDEDRSYTGKFKNEIIIQLGILLEKELPNILNTDTAYFMNAIPKYGLIFRAAYDSSEQKLYGDYEELKNLDYVLYLEKYQLKSRIHRSVYIQSNRMVTERIPIEVANFDFLIISPKDNKVLHRSHICLDKINDKVSKKYFDFYSAKSGTGKFLASSFSAWWMDLGKEGNFSCGRN